MAEPKSTIEAFDPATRSFNVIASTRAPVRGFEQSEAGEEPTPRLESLDSWDLERFLANPVVLVNHDTADVGSIIGGASNIRETERGLEMTVTLVTARANPDADRVAELIATDVLRGVSVGFEYGERTDEVRDGQVVAVFRGNIVNEVSLVTVPADAGALVSDAAERSPTYNDYGAAVFELRERWLETESAEDYRAFREASADFESRQSRCPPGQHSCRTTFDTAKKTRTSCDCPTHGECVCRFNPDSRKETKTDMTQKSADYQQGLRDFEARRRESEGDVDYQRQLQAAQARRSRAPLSTTVPSAVSSQMALDSWSMDELRDRPNTATVAPDRATSKPNPGHSGATIGPKGAAAPARAVPSHLRSFRELGIPGALSKENSGFGRPMSDLRGAFDRPRFEDDIDGGDAA